MLGRDEPWSLSKDLPQHWPGLCKQAMKRLSPPKVVASCTHTSLTLSTSPHSLKHRRLIRGCCLSLFTPCTYALLAVRSLTDPVNCPYTAPTSSQHSAIQYKHRTNTTPSHNQIHFFKNTLTFHQQTLTRVFVTSSQSRTFSVTYTFHQATS